MKKVSRYVGPKYQSRISNAATGWSDQMIISPLIWPFPSFLELYNFEESFFAVFKHAIDLVTGNMG